MTDKRCHYCGVKLDETTHGRWYSPNHGIVEGDVDNEEGKRNYIR